MGRYGAFTICLSTWNRNTSGDKSWHADDYELCFYYDLVQHTIWWITTSTQPKFEEQRHPYINTSKTIASTQWLNNNISIRLEWNIMMKNSKIEQRLLTCGHDTLVLNHELQARSISRVRGEGVCPHFFPRRRSCHPPSPSPSQYNVHATRDIDNIYVRVWCNMG